MTDITSDPSTPGAWSVFLSHSSADKAFARRLAADLRRHGVQVWLDEAEIMVGDSLVTKISSAADTARYVAVLLSKSSATSSWVQFELEIAIHRQINGRTVVVLPVMIEDCFLPICLRGVAYADFRNPGDYERALGELLRRFELKDHTRQTDLRDLRIGVIDSGGGFTQSCALALEYVYDTKIETINLATAGLEVDALYSYLSEMILGFDAVILPLSLSQFCSLRIAEIIHLHKRPTRTLLASGSSFLERHGARPLFNVGLRPFITHAEIAESIARELRAPPNTTLSYQDLYREIAEYLRDASCFRWGHGSMRHAPPNAVSLEEYKSGVDLHDLQLMYDAYAKSKREPGPVQESHLIAAARAGEAVTSNDTLFLLSRQLLILITEAMTHAEMDGKSEPVSLLAAAAKAARAGSETKARGALRAASPCLVAGGGERLTFGQWAARLAAADHLHAVVAALETAAAD